MARLTKRDVERLLNRYDSDPIGALTEALQRVLEAPESTFDELVVSPPFDATRRAALLARDTTALDDLAAELNESRSLG